MSLAWELPRTHENKAQQLAQFIDSRYLLIVCAYCPAISCLGQKHLYKSLCSMHTYTR